MGERLNIALTGFMGTGKSTVGRRLARDLGLKFLDIDDLIEKEAGLPVKEIFRTLGEASFRRTESEVIEKLRDGSFGTGIVLSTGGGAVVDPLNRKRLRDWGVLVCLTASLDEILRRVGNRDDRPLLSGPDSRGTAERLMAERQEAYSEADFTVDTTSAKVEDVVERIKGFLEKRR